MTIHSDHPFADPASARDPVRRFRGRLGGAVTLWTAGQGRERAGLTVSSVMLTGGTPARMLALLDPDSDLATALASTCRGVVHLLQWEDRGLAEMFAGTAPAPGGMFAQADFVDTSAGPRLTTASSWLEVTLEESREVGWSLLVTARIDAVSVGDDDVPLVHRRGRFLPPP